MIQGDPVTGGAAIGGEDLRIELPGDPDTGPESLSVIETGGGRLAFADIDHDGHPETMYELDEHGGVLAEARFDGQRHAWVPVSGEVAVPEGMRVGTTDGGETVLTAPTEDTDGDGRADTTIVHTGDGGALLYTDVDGDGAADVVTEISATGEVTVARHTGPGTWSAVERGRIGADGAYHGWDDPTGDGVWGDGDPQPVPPTHVDPRTGRWTGN